VVADRQAPPAGAGLLAVLAPVVGQAMLLAQPVLVAYAALARAAMVAFVQLWRSVHGG